MKYVFLLLTMTLCMNVYAIPWPSVSEPRITSCGNTIKYKCSKEIVFKHNGTVFVDEPELIEPPEGAGLSVSTWAVHCRTGSRLPGEEEPFDGCYLALGSMYAPSIYDKCERESKSSWKLTNSSKCTTSQVWGGNSGAGPGGACVIFGIAGPGGQVIYTPSGPLNANAIANSGNARCVKALPPATECDLQLNDTVLDHGVLPPNASSTESVTGVIDCGIKPVIDIVGGDNFMIAAGINGKLNVDMDTENKKIKINSIVTTVDAKGGDYNYSKIIVLSPW